MSEINTTIRNWVKADSRVLDLGCGDGNLLTELQQNLGILGYGLEIDPLSIQQCVARGVNVIEQDLNKGLANFSDNSFGRNQLKLKEILGINAFYNHDIKTALSYLTDVFTTTTDSLQKAKTTENLIKINQQISNYQQAQYFINYSKQHYGLYLTFKERYNLQILEAKNALALGFTKKAENIIIHIHTVHRSWNS